MQVSKMAGRSSRADSSKDIHSPTSNMSLTSPIPTPPPEPRASSSDRRRLSRKRPTTAPGGDTDYLRSKPSISEMSSSPGDSNTSIPRIAPPDASLSKLSTDSSVARSIETMRGTEDSHTSLNRPSLAHHPRSASTDSALPRKVHNMGPPSPTVTGVCLPFAPDPTDENGARKKKNRFRAKRLWKS